MCSVKVKKVEFMETERRIVLIEEGKETGQSDEIKQNTGGICPFFYSIVVLLQYKIIIYFIKT